jgi:hypothetical protein
VERPLVAGLKGVGARVLATGGAGELGDTGLARPGIEQSSSPHG